MEEVRKQAKQKGRQEGERETKVEIAKRLLNALDEETISQMTGLSIEEIRHLR